MEVDGMYQNTPWENLSLWAPWLGLGGLVIAIVLYLVARRGADFDPELFDARTHVAHLIGAYALSLATLGVLFTIMWRPAHDTYPHAFGRAALGVAAAAAVVGAIVAIVRRTLMHPAIIYGTLTASACVAAAISAFSHSIIAEGQVTAMVLPVGYVTAALFASIIAIPWSSYEHRYEAATVIAFVILAYVATDKLPVVQFRDDGSVFPILGGLFIVVLGRLARSRALPVMAAAIVAITAIAIGYFTQWWFGIAIAAVGLSISGGWGLLHQPSEEYLPPYSTHA